MKTSPGMVSPMGYNNNYFSWSNSVVVEMIGENGYHVQPHFFLENDGSYKTTFHNLPVGKYTARATLVRE